MTYLVKGYLVVGAYCSTVTFTIYPVKDPPVGANYLITNCLTYILKDTSCSDECRHKPLVELVDDLEVHVAGRPCLFVHQVERGMSDELVQMAVIINLKHQTQPW